MKNKYYHPHKIFVVYVSYFHARKYRFHFDKANKLLNIRFGEILITFEYKPLPKL